MIEIAIDELVVRGLSPDAARLVAASLEERLTELAAAGAVRPRQETFRRLAPVGVTDDPRALGHALAGAVWSAVA